MSENKSIVTCIRAFMVDLVLVEIIQANTIYTIMCKYTYFYVMKNNLKMVETMVNKQERNYIATCW